MSLVGKGGEGTATEAFVEGKNPVTKNGVDSAHSIQFSGCVVLKPTTKPCEITGDDITTEAVVSELAAGPPVTDAFTPKGTKFATFKLTGAGCGILAGSYTVKGKTKCEVPGAAVSAKKHSLKCTEGKELEVGEEKGEMFEGTAELELASGKTWDAD